MSKVYCCGRIMESNFCPTCGKTLDEAIKANKTPFPYRFEIYLHGDNGEGKDEIINELGLESGDPLINDITGCDYEVKLTYEIQDENSGVKLIGCDDIRLSDEML